MKVLYTKAQAKFIKANFSKTEGPGGNYYHMPFVYKEVDEDIFEILTIEELPKGVKERFFPETVNN